MKNILVLHTGGTISMSENDAGEIMPNENNPLNQFKLAADVPLNLQTEEIFNLPSPHITPKEMLQLQQRILKAEADGIDGVVITHGTDTLEETAYFQEMISKTTVNLNELVSGVFLIKAYAGMDAAQFEFLDDDRTHGVVIEALGAGNLPPQTLPAIQKLLDRNIPIVLVSRCFNGVAEPVYNYEGGGVGLKQMGITFCQGLNGPKARIKLLVGLSAHMQKAKLNKFVSNAVS